MRANMAMIAPGGNGQIGTNRDQAAQPAARDDHLPVAIAAFQSRLSPIRCAPSGLPSPGMAHCTSNLMQQMRQRTDI